MRGILIDPTTKTVSEVQLGKGIDEIYKLIEARPFSVVTLTEDSNGRRESLYLDDEGLLHEDPGPFFKLVWYPQPIAGKGLILGTEPSEGDSVDTMMTLKTVQEAVSWPNIKLKGMEHFEGETELYGKKAFVIGFRPIFVPADGEQAGTDRENAGSVEDLDSNQGQEPAPTQKDGDIS